MKLHFTSLVSVVTLLCLVSLRAEDELQDKRKGGRAPQGTAQGGRQSATCNMAGNGKAGITGTLTFTKVPVGLTIYGQIVYPGGNPDGLYGFHIHNGPLTGNDCTTTDGHYNPFHQTHGGPPSYGTKRHFGDFGNVAVNTGQGGQNFVSLLFDRATLEPLKADGSRPPTSVLGLILTMHAGTDDLGKGPEPGSAKNGNSGTPIGCCVIQ